MLKRMRMRNLIALASILLLVGSASTDNQHFLQFDSDPLSPGLGLGRLWRFSIDRTTSAFEEVLELVYANELDLWQIGHSHLDVYVPNPVSAATAALPEALLKFQHVLWANISTPQVPRRSYAAAAKWDLPQSIQTLQNTTFHAEYHTLSEINEFIEEMARRNPDLVRMRKVGHSGMGKEMLGLVVSKGEAGMGKWKRKTRRPKEKLSFVILGAQHAREWIATATSLYLTHALVSDPSEPYSLSHLLDVFDFHIIPVPNPDGYEYTWEKDRFWYKTRQKISPKEDCLGIDMNRNWGYKWQSAQLRGHGHSKLADADPCSHWYPGHRPFEASEVNNIANMVMTIPNLVGFLDLRSYGQMLSSPFSYSCTAIPKDAEDQLEAGLGAARMMSRVHGAAVTTGSLCSNLYRAPGNVIDWMYKRVGVKYTYAVHLRDTGTYGFALPARWIRPVGEETSAMVDYLARFIATRLKRDI